MRTVTRCIIASVLLLGIMGAVSSAAAQSSPAQNSAPAVAVDKAQMHPIGPVTGKGHGPVHVNYDCTATRCTCVGAKDCGTMGADQVCMSGTFQGDATGGTCTEKKL